MASAAPQQIGASGPSGSLLASMSLKGLGLANRLVVAPMTRVSATVDGRPTPHMVA